MTWAPAPNTQPAHVPGPRSPPSTARATGSSTAPPNAFVGRYSEAALVVRVQGIDAGVRRSRATRRARSARIHIATDEPSLDLRIFHVRPRAGRHLRRQPVRRRRHRPASRRRSTGRSGAASRDSISFRIPNVPSGLYYAPVQRRRTAASATRRSSSARRSSARPAACSSSCRRTRWQAYNFQDVDGNGYGDTWYAGPPNRPSTSSRTYIARGVPPRFYRYDLPFLHWLYWSGKSAEFISDSDFDLIATATSSPAPTTWSSSRGTRST